MTTTKHPLTERPPRKIRVEEAAQIARWSRRTFDRHRPYFKTYLLTRPGKRSGTRLVDYEDFMAYLERHAQGEINVTSTENPRGCLQKAAATHALEAFPETDETMHTYPFPENSQAPLRVLNTASRPGPTQYDCIAEAGCARYAVFEVTPPEAHRYWIIASIPKSWKNVRSSSRVPSSPDGGVERPFSVIKPFTTCRAALVAFERWTR